MTPAARVQAAIELLDRVLGGVPAEQALTGWARGARYAGSGDRAAVRDHVFDGLRQLRSATARAGAEAPSGRAVMIGLLGREGCADLFTGAGHAPAPLTAGEVARIGTVEARDAAVRLDCPDWLVDRLKAALGAGFEPMMQAAQRRAPVYLRTNLRKGDRAVAVALLGEDGIGVEAVEASETALRVTEKHNKISQSRAFLEGRVELQDLSSQLAVERLPLKAGSRVLDYCAGGGGKVLAMAGRVSAHFTAHDAAPARMGDLPARAARAGVKVALAARPGHLVAAGYDLVLVDAPCSGSGTWARTPDAKWRLTEARLAELVALQADILVQAARFVRRPGHLAYMTCSCLDAENGAQVRAFLADRVGVSLTHEEHFGPATGGDGFYLAILSFA